jgi:lipopolysaccharide cholinephosphotransferase
MVQIKIDKNSVNFPTTSEYPREMINRVQKELLEMISIVSSILEKKNVPYSIAYGTLIGAIKFEGFLPWDDDIDIFLFDDSYEYAISILEKELPKHLIVHSQKNDPNYFLAWNKVKNLNIAVEDNDIYNPDNKLLGFKNLGIDLYRLKKVKLIEANDYLRREAELFFKKKLDCGIIREDEYEKQIKNLASFQKFSLTKSSNIELEDYVYVFVVKMNQPILPKHIFPLKRYKFENLSLLGPNDSKSVLLTYFSNIKDLPPYEERKPHLKKVKFYE